MSKIAKRFVSIVATLVMVATMVPTASVAFAAQNASASKAASTSSEIGAVYGAKELTAKTHSITESGAYYVAKDTNINPGTESGNGIKIEENLEVLIYIPAGLTLTVTGVNGYGADGEGCAAIYLPETSKLTISGGGTINAIGGNAAAGGRGGDGAAAICDEESSGGPYYSAGWGGKGGDGGAGAGAGIGTNGGKGGKGGDGGAGKNSEGFYSEDGAGEDGEDGEDGSAAEKPGQVFFAGSLTVNCQGGQTSTTKATGGKGNANHMRKNSFFAYTTCGGAGGGAGASGEAAYGIGSGGNGGAGGGGGGGGGHYRDGVGGSSYIGYYYCGGEGGAGALGCEGAASGEDGTATEDISDKLGTKYTSKGGLAGISTEGSTKSDVIDYRNTSTGKKCTYKFDRKDNSLVNVMTDSTVQSFISDEGYTTQYTIKSNGGTYGGTATEYTVDVVPGADPVTDPSTGLYNIMVSTDSSTNPLRSGYTLLGYSTTENADGQFFSRTQDGDTVSGEWKTPATDNSLFADGYVVGELGTDEETLQNLMWTACTPATLYAVWQAHDYTVTYNRNETLLNTLGVKTMPNWVKVSDTSITKTTTETTDSGFTYDTAAKLAISSSMHSNDGVDFPSNQQYYLQSVNNGQYVLKGWTKSIDAKGEATDAVYQCGDEVTRLTEDFDVTLYAVWGSASDIKSPSFIEDGDLTLPFDYSADAARLNVRATPYWGQNAAGEYGSYFLAAIYGENPSRTLSTDWQMYNESSGEWTTLNTSGTYGGYTSLLDESQFENDFTFNSPDYKAGNYVKRFFTARLNIPRGANVGTSNKYRVVFKLSPVSGSTGVEEFRAYSQPMSFSVIKADYDMSNIVIYNDNGNKVSTNSYKTQYDGNSHYLKITGLPDKLTATISYYYENEQKYLDNGSYPVEPGTYYAHIMYSNSEINYNTPAEKTIKVTITKKTVPNPIPKDLTYKIADYSTGEAAVQCAFDESDLYTATGASASQVGDYTAKFTINDTDHYEWLVGTAKEKEIRYSISPLKVSIDSDSINVSDKSYTLTWSNTTNTYDGGYKTAKVTSDLFSNGSGEAQFPDWLTGWKDGKPYSTNAAYFVYYLDNGDGTFSSVVGYDDNNHPITKEQIEAWKSGSSESGVDQKSFSDIANFGVKDKNVKQVSIAFDVQDSNMKISGTATSPFTIAPQGISAIKFSTVKSGADGTTKYVPMPSYVNSSGTPTEGLPVGVDSVTFYEFDTSTGTWKTDVWGKYSAGGATTGGISTPLSEDVQLKAVFEMSNASYEQIDYQLVSFNVELAGGIVDVPTAATNLIYNGKAQRGIQESDAYVLSGDISGTNVGTYTTTVTPADGYVWVDGTSASKDIEWSIAKKSVEAPTAASGLVYTGESQDGVSAGEGYTVDGGSQVNAGTYTAHVTLLSDNYKWNVRTVPDYYDVTWSIAKKEIASPQAVSGLVYNGKAQQGVAVGNGYYLEGASATDAGGYLATATLDGNHTWDDGDTGKKYISWNIAQKPIEIPKAVSGLVYNGSKQVGVKDGEGYVLSGTTSATEVGKYEAYASLEASGNYIWTDSSSSEKTIKWEITKTAGTPVDVPSGITHVYNGKAQTGITNNDAYTVYGTNKAINAGTYTATLVLNDGYSWSDGSVDKAKDVKWTISKAKASAKITKKTKKAKRSKLVKKAVKLKAITVSGLPSNTYVSFVKVKKGSGKKAYKLLKVKKSNGKITVKKGTKKGTYKLKVKVTVTGANYNAYVKTITIKIKVK